MIITKNADGYGYKYTDLAQIHRLLEENGLSYQQYVEPHANGNDYIMTVMIDKDGNESEPVRGCKIPTATLSGKSNPAQEYGSAITYARRYSLLMAYGLATTDDDAESLTTDKRLTPQQAKTFEDFLIKMGKDVAEAKKYYGVKDFTEMTERQYGQAVRLIARKKEERNV